jgi:large conductance mechanosensitive channel
MARSGGFWRDFQAFINRGNMVDLAVAVILGSAFGKVIEAIVNWLMTTILQPTLKQLNIDQLRTWPLGEVLVALINFLAIAFTVYLIIRALERFRLKQMAGNAAPDPVALQQQMVDSLERIANSVESRRL